jgi:hypothetical protein
MIAEIVFIASSSHDLSWRAGELGNWSEINEGLSPLVTRASSPSIFRQLLSSSAPQLPPFEAHRRDLAAPRGAHP